MERSNYIIILFLFVFYSLSSGQEFLEPEDGMDRFDVLTEYHNNVQKILLNNLDFRPIFRMICIPAFTPEWVVEIGKHDSLGLSVVSVTSEDQIWYSIHASGDKKPLKPESIKMKYIKVKIDSSTAFQIYEIIQNMLANTRYMEKSSIGLDGVNFHFLSWKRGDGFRYGKVWSPEEKSKTYKLAKLGSLIYDYTQKDSSQSILQKIKKLLNTFWE